MTKEHGLIGPRWAITHWNRGEWVIEPSTDGDFVVLDHSIQMSIFRGTLEECRAFAPGAPTSGELEEERTKEPPHYLPSEQEDEDAKRDLQFMDRFGRFPENWDETNGMKLCDKHGYYWYEDGCLACQNGD